MGKFRWAIEAGDQIGHSEDDKPCGEHFIDKDLECHDGDAHRPTPGKNPYWQDGRGGPPSEPDSKGPSGDRDREKLTKKAGEKQEQREREAKPKTPEDYARNTLEDLKEQAERAFEEQGQELQWDERRQHELMEMVMRDTAREFNLDPEELGMFDPSVPYEPYTTPERGYKGRALWRPRTYEEPSTTPRDEGGVEPVPPEYEPEGGPGLYQKMQDVFDEKPERPEASLVGKINWSISKIMQDRVPDQARKGCPDEGKLLALDSALPDLPGDSAQGRECGEDESYPEKCTGPGGGGMPSPSDDPKFLQRGKQAQPPAGVGLGPEEDPQRAQRTSQHVQNLKRVDPANSKQAAWAMDKMFGTRSKPSKDGGTVGGGRTASPEQAKQQYDDARFALEQSGWQNTSDMPGQSSYSKGSANISLHTDQTGTAYKVHAPPKQKKRGLFGKLNWTVAKGLPFPGAAPPFGSEAGDDEAESEIKTEHSGAKKGKGAWYGKKKEAKQVSKKARRQVGKKAAQGILAGQLDWSTTGRPCGDDEKYPEKCGPGEEGYNEPGGEGWYEDVERDLMGEDPMEEMVPEQIEPTEPTEPVAPVAPQPQTEGLHEFWTTPRGDDPISNVGQRAIDILRTELENVSKGIPSKLVKMTPEQAERKLREGPRNLPPEPEVPGKQKRGRRGSYKPKKLAVEETPEDKAAREYFLGEDPYTGPIV